MFAVRLPEELEARLNHLSSETHRSKSYYVKKALQKFLDEQAEYEFAAVAYKDFLESGRKTTSFDDVMKENGLEPL
jgi:RHH-type rel operon transcriptional repressor/antitoxin RelB